MFEAPFDWNSFWDLTRPAEAAATFREIRGAAATEAAAGRRSWTGDSRRMRSWSDGWMGLQPQLEHH